MDEHDSDIAPTHPAVPEPLTPHSGVPIAAPAIEPAQLAQIRAQLMTKLFEDSPESTVIGHYEVLRELGRGGMGVVHLARDRTLDRKVAIKQLPIQSPELRARFEREAKAMAKLAHPNVVQVYETGETESSTYIAMEYVEGVTLKTWLGSPRSREEILGVFRAAGRGLAAAHEAGLVHRDFKPDNVMIRSDGRVLVMDFGLAGGEPARKLDERTASVDEPTLTATGLIMGTPAYMAPEQWRDARVDAKADQFAFCVALWEALHGERPFDDSSFAALQAAVMAGEFRAPKRWIPQWIQQVLERGLALEAERRFGSMQTLIDELGSNPAGRLWTIGSVIAVMLVVAWLVSALVSKARDVDRMQRAQIQLHEIEAATQDILDGDTPIGSIESLVIAVELASHFGPGAADELGAEFEMVPTVVNDAMSPAPWKPRLALIGHSDRILDVDWSQDGIWLATGGKDHTVRVWDSRNGAARYVVELEGEVVDVEFSPEGAWVIAVTTDERVTVLDAESGRVERMIDSCVAFTLTPDGELVTVSNDGSVRVSLPDSKHMRLEFVGPGGETRSIVSASHARSIAYDHEDGWTHLNIVTGESYTALHDDSTIMAIAHDGGVIATAGSNGIAQFWRKNGTLFFETGNHGRKVRSIEFSPEDDRVVLVAYHDAAELWDLESRRRVHYYPSRVFEATFSSDGQDVLTTTDLGAIVWMKDARIEDLIWAYPLDWRPLARFSPDARHIVTTGWSRAEIWSRSASPARRVQVNGQAGQTLSLAAIAHDGGSVAAASIDTVWIWSSSGVLTSTLSGLEAPIIGLAAVDDGGFWVITSSSGLLNELKSSPLRYERLKLNTLNEVVEIWDVASRQRVQGLSNDPRQPTVGASMRNETRFANRIRRSPDGMIERVVTISKPHAADLELIVGLRATVTPSGDGNRLLVRDDGLSVWDTRTRRKIRQLSTDRYGVVFALSSEGRLAADVSQSGRLRIWNVMTGAFQARNAAPNALAVAFSPDNHDVLIISADGTFERHALEPVLEACQQLASTTRYSQVAVECARARLAAEHSHNWVSTEDADAALWTSIAFWLSLAVSHLVIPVVWVTTGFAARLRKWSGHSSVRRMAIVALFVAPCMLLSILGSDIERVGRATIDLLALEWLAFTAITTLACHVLLWAVRHRSRWWLWVALAVWTTSAFLVRWNPNRVVESLDRYGALLAPAMRLVLRPLAELAGNEAVHGSQAHVDAHAEAHHGLLVLAGFALMLVLGLWLVDRIRLVLVARLGHRFGFEQTNVVTLPVLLAVIHAVSLAFVPLAVAGLRALEREADRTALALTQDPSACVMEATLDARGDEDDFMPALHWDAKQVPFSERVETCNTYRPWDPEPPHFWDLALEVATPLRPTLERRPDL